MMHLAKSLRLIGLLFVITYCYLGEFKTVPAGTHTTRAFPMPEFRGMMDHSIAETLIRAMPPQPHSGANAVSVAPQETPQKDMASIEVKPTRRDPHDSRRFKMTFPVTRSVKEIRADDYGIGTSKPILINWYPGGKRCDLSKLRRTTEAVIQRLPNLKTTPDLVNLLMETMIAETGAGQEKWETGISKWKNYGIAQFRIDTAEDLLAWLKDTRPDVHDQVMLFFDDNEDLQYNLVYNVPFSIAMMAQYYWRAVPDLYAHIGTRVQRGQVWKARYNTHLGLGTVNKYIDRCAELDQLLVAANR